MSNSAPSLVECTVIERLECGDVTRLLLRGSGVNFRLFGVTHVCPDGQFDLAIGETVILGRAYLADPVATADHLSRGGPALGIDALRAMAALILIASRHGLSRNDTDMAAAGSSVATHGLAGDDPAKAPSGDAEPPPATPGGENLEWDKHPNVADHDVLTSVSER